MAAQENNKEHCHFKDLNYKGDAESRAKTSAYTTPLAYSYPCTHLKCDIRKPKMDNKYNTVL